MKNESKNSFYVIGYGEEWKKNVMERDKEEIVFMLGITGRENLRLRKELKDLENTVTLLRERIEILNKG